MPIYIDADALKEQMESVCMGIMAGTDSYNAPLKTIDDAPTADVRENVLAHWYGFFDGDEYRVYCSHCKDNWYEEDLWMGGNEFPKYCPNCGAQMDERRDDGVQH